MSLVLFFIAHLQHPQQNSPVDKLVILLQNPEMHEIQAIIAGTQVISTE